jgi:hypothetical protein
MIERKTRAQIDPNADNLLPAVHIEAFLVREAGWVDHDVEEGDINGFMTGVYSCLPLDEEDEFKIWVRMPLKVPNAAPTVESLAPLCYSMVKAETFQKSGYRLIRHLPVLSFNIDY